jgi:hypothetical protein
LNRIGEKGRAPSGAEALAGMLNKMDDRGAQQMAGLFNQMAGPQGSQPRPGAEKK